MVTAGAEVVARRRERAVEGFTLLIGVPVASYAVGDGDANNGTDYFAVDKAWWYITLLTIGYMISRGLAKIGSRSSDEDPRTH